MRRGNLPAPQTPTVIPRTPPSSLRRQGPTGTLLPGREARPFTFDLDTPLTFDLSLNISTPKWKALSHPKSTSLCNVFIISYNASILQRFFLPLNLARLFLL